MATTAEAYRWFADFEFEGASPTYAAWARRIAQDDAVLSLIEALPQGKRRPHLVFAAARVAGAPVGPYDPLRAWLLEHWPEVEAIAAVRSVQTNEAGRCATLLPVLAQLEGPLALLEVGASAGACLYPDRYSYEYAHTARGEPLRTETRLDPAVGRSPVLLPCDIEPPEAVPARLPEVVWRAGIDLNPLSFSDSGDTAWLRALVWPEQAERRARLDAVASIVRADPPWIERGDANELLPEVAAQAPEDATLVVFHTAVLSYFAPEDRDRFAETVAGLDATWLSNEGRDVLPWVRDALDPALEVGASFILARDRVPVAVTGGHGQSYRAL